MPSPSSSYLPPLKYSVRGAIERQRDVLARRVAGLLDRLHDEAERLVGAGQVGRKAAFVADIGGVAGVLQFLLQRVEDFRAHAHGVGHRRPRRSA